MDYRLYTDLAHWWPLLSSRESYAEEACAHLELLDQALGQRATQILELGSGGGMLASHIGADREVVLTDSSPEMLSLCRTNNPTREVLQADMRSLRLGRRFDAVLLHDAVMYLTTPADLSQTFAAAAAHLRPGGVLLILPDVVKESFQEQTVSGGTTGQPAAQLLEWHWDPDPDDQTYQVDMSYLLKSDTGEIQSVHEQHTLGLFESRTYVQLLREAGFEMVDGLIWDEHQLPEVFCGRLR